MVSFFSIFFYIILQKNKKKTNLPKIKSFIEKFADIKKNDFGTKNANFYKKNTNFSFFLV
ncbi:MAG: hypothetical protein EAZ97_14410 [Bacteroidetes bacterium]|nr:MAG: hypothetical protein EAZ97_14410 [Bacteroidota bacterium]